MCRRKGNGPTGKTSASQGVYHRVALKKHTEANLDTLDTYDTGCTAAVESECILLGRIEDARRQRAVNPKYERTAPVEPGLS